jgi:hypothetical protein
MSMSPELPRPAADRLVTVISRWLARHIGDADLRDVLDEIGVADLAPDQAEAVFELRAELDAAASPGDLERVARETLEALALG